MLRQTSLRMLLACAAIAIGVDRPFVFSAPGDPQNPTILTGDASAQDAATSVRPGEGASAVEAQTPVVEQSYVGTNQCFICHRPQTSSWSESDHAHAFTHVPKIYRNDPACLTCHVTGFAVAGGYVAGTAKDLLMVGCESCHGPGALHIDAALRFVLSTASDEATIEKEMRESIIKTPTDGVCLKCHKTQGHQSHPGHEGRPPRQMASGSDVQSNPALAVARRTSATTATVRQYSSRYNIKTCGSCHYDQYLQWRAEKHSALSAMLPAQPGNDQNCQICHPAADAAAERSAVPANTHPNQIGVACESCHGLALEHVRYTVQFIGAPPLGPRLEHAARLSIREGKPATTCVQCHVRQSHKQHPQFAKK